MAPECVAQTKGPTPRFVVTPVHGTFAQNALWVRVGSPFCELLARSLPGTVKLCPFHWSGGK
jgi:hypothetical protein